MLPPVAGGYLAAVLLLGGAGAAKLRRPDDTAGALRVAGLPSRPGLVRVGASAELAVAIAAFTARGPWPAVLVAVSYGSFTVFVATALTRSWPIASCGCFARPDTPPALSHLLLDLAATGAAIWWAIAAPAWWWPQLFRQAGHGTPLLLLTVALATVAYLLFTRSPVH
ncbi:MAG: hypothetical protein M3R71_00955 [Actinomycetota bacterium]|nr:hypothetical protein [Actinomycetota bacterium]